MKPHRFLMYTLVPLLAIGGYIAADLLMAPVKTDAPKAYRLLAQKDCNLSTQCVLQHEGLVISLTRELMDQQGELRLKLESSKPLKGAAISLGRKEEAEMPQNMRSLDGARQWAIILQDGQSPGVLRLLLSTQETSYFAEIPVSL
jgi:hypothetical protein